MFVAGGEIIKDTRMTFVDTIFVFEEGEWRQVANVKTPRANHAVSSITLLQEKVEKFCN